MESMNLLINGFAIVFTWSNLTYCLIGVSIGMLVGILPGLGPTAGTAILLPLTFGMDPIAAIIMLSGIYYGAMYGGTITSVLINTPGEATSVITCIEGYALAKQGRAGVALGVAAIGSFVGGTLAIVGLAAIGPSIARMALKFGPPEFFCLMILGLTMLLGLMGKSIVRGCLSASLGMVLALVGTDPTNGTIRFIMGKVELMNGFDIAVVAMGMFGIAEIMANVGGKPGKRFSASVRNIFPRKDELRPTISAIGRGTGIGFAFGLIPGANGIVSTLLSYAVEKKLSKRPERFGNGAVEGVAGPETANNAFSGASLIPLFTLGIPTSPTVAILLGAFIMHGLTPGPILFEQHPNVVWGVIASMFIGNVILLIMNLPLVNVWAQITRVPYPILFPFVLLVAIVGAYSLNGLFFDVLIMTAFGLIGYIFKMLDIPLAPAILTFVLGGQIETSFLQSMSMSGGNYLMFFERPISGLLLGLCVLILGFSLFRKKRDMLPSDLDD